jgi:hypothetical protein
MKLNFMIWKRYLSEKFYLWFVWKLPKSIILWSTIRLVANATTGKYENTIVPELTAMEALKRWE